jgi:hypothetical protein
MLPSPAAMHAVIFCASQALTPLWVAAYQDPELYAKLPEPTDDENDMLDLAYGLTETCAASSQLQC